MRLLQNVYFIVLNKKGEVIIIIDMPVKIQV